MHLSKIVGKFEKQDVREWYPSTTGPTFTTYVHLVGRCYTSGSLVKLS